MKSEFRADTAKLLELANENERLRADLAAAREVIEAAENQPWRYEHMTSIRACARAFLERTTFEPTPGDRADANEISRLRADLSEAERKRDEYYADYMRIVKGHDDMHDQRDDARTRAGRAEAALAAAREVIEPLLDHYLNCYEGNTDRLVYDARAFLERTAKPRPGSPE